MNSCVFHNCLFLVSFQSDRFQSGIPADFYRPKPKISSQKPPSSPLPGQRPPGAQLLATQAEGDLLLGALRRYLSGRLSPHGGRAGPEEPEAPESRPRPFYSAAENPGLQKDTAKSRVLKSGRTQGASARDPLTSVDGTCFRGALTIHALIQPWWFFCYAVVCVASGHNDEIVVVSKKKTWSTAVKHKARGPNPGRHIIFCGPWQLERHVITFS